ncbi:hypothetical protein GXW74_00960 [Roseomonas eburnea]|uniref:Uncharacterized protein n=1 Tax=Neoroseomonas eburnea TaxID=1346889 RepID=A0A9X9X5Q6_9PROT|nr:hypothetical protein [Neoroseomonas eburnea]MBR0679042.1 hypothetical protein [Neoroseomonas eburnea]
MSSQPLPRLAALHRLRTLLPSDEQLVWLTSLGLGLLAVVALLERHVWGDTSPIFWDLPVYVATSEAQARGLDPYAPEVMRLLGLPDYLFVNSPPIATWLLGLAGGTPLRPHLGALLALAHVGALLAMPLVLGRVFFGHGMAGFALAAAAFLTMFAGAGITSVSAANLGTVLHAVILLALAPGLLRGRWAAFFVAVALASLFKPFYLAYCLLPAAANGWNWRHALVGAGISATVLVAHAASALIAPEAFSGWIANLRAAILVQGDTGTNLLGARALRDGGALRYLVQAAVIVAFLAVALLGRIRGRALWAALLIVVQFVNPRMMVYDLAVAAIPFAFLAAPFIPAGRGPLARIGIAVGAVSVVQFAAYNGRLLDGSLLFPLMALALVLAACCAGRAAEERAGS